MSVRLPCLAALCLGTAAVAALAPAMPARADEITDQLGLIEELYAAGDYGEMITELEFVLQDIRGRMGALYAETFPEPPAGWSAEPAQNDGGAAFMGGSILNRTYTEDGGSGRIDAQLMVDNPMIQGMAGLFANPQLLAAQPNARRIRVGRDNAVLTFDPANGSGEVTFLVGGRILMQLEGSGLDSGDPLETLLNAWDFDDLKRIAGN